MLELAALDPLGEQAGDGVPPALQPVGIGVDQVHGKAVRQCAVGNTGAHRSGAEHRHRRERAARAVLGDAGHLCDLAFSKERMAQTIRLWRRLALEKEFAFQRAAGFVVAAARRFDTFDDLKRRKEAALPTRNVCPRVGEQRVVDFANRAIPNARWRQLGDSACMTDRRREQVAFRR